MNKNLLISERTREYKPAYPQAFLLQFSLVCPRMRTKITALRQDEDSGILQSDWRVERVRGTDENARPTGEAVNGGHSITTPRGGGLIIFSGALARPACFVISTM